MRFIYLTTIALAVIAVLTFMSRPESPRQQFCNRCPKPFHAITTTAWAPRQQAVPQTRIAHDYGDTLRWSVDATQPQLAFPVPADLRAELRHGEVVLVHAILVRWHAASLTGARAIAINVRCHWRSRSPTMAAKSWPRSALPAANLPLLSSWYLAMLVAAFAPADTGIIQATLMSRVSPIVEHWEIAFDGTISATFGYFNPNAVYPDDASAQAVLTNAGLTAADYSQLEFENFRDGVVVIPQGGQNRFVGDTAQLNPTDVPTEFMPGRIKDLFLIPYTDTFDQGNIVWVLNGRTTTAANPGNNAGLVDVEVDDVEEVEEDEEGPGEPAEDSVDADFTFKNPNPYKVIVVPSPPIVLPPPFIGLIAGGNPTPPADDAADNYLETRRRRGFFAFFLTDFPRFCQVVMTMPHSNCQVSSLLKAPEPCQCACNAGLFAGCVGISTETWHRFAFHRIYRQQIPTNHRRFVVG